MKSIVIVLTRSKFIPAILIVISMLVVSSAAIIINAFNGRNILDGKIIVVDAGHGGVDSGANNSYVKEKDINLDIALKLQKKLESNGARVVMTRIADVELSKTRDYSRSRYISDLKARVDIVNNSSAHIFLSIHANSNKNNPSTRGVIAFYANSHSHNREMAYIFQNIFNTYEFLYMNRAYKSHHVPQKGNYYLLVNAKIPGIIIETGFITNGTDLLLLQNAEYRDYIADAICQGVVNYFLCSDNLHKNIDDTIYIEEEHAIDMADEDKEQN